MSLQNSTRLEKIAVTTPRRPTPDSSALIANREINKENHEEKKRNDIDENR
jgi:hypothetical protein